MEWFGRAPAPPGGVCCWDGASVTQLRGHRARDAHKAWPENADVAERQARRAALTARQRDAPEHAQAGTKEQPHGANKGTALNPISLRRPATLRWRSSSRCSATEAARFTLALKGKTFAR